MSAHCGAGHGLHALQSRREEVAVIAEDPGHREWQGGVRLEACNESTATPNGRNIQPSQACQRGARVRMPGLGNSGRQLQINIHRCSSAAYCMAVWQGNATNRERARGTVRDAPITYGRPTTRSLPSFTIFSVIGKNWTCSKGGTDHLYVKLTACAARGFCVS